MSELKCPFCQQEIKIAGEHTTIMSCFNGDCKGSGLYGEKAFWQELIHTRKALEQSEICCSEWEKQALDYKAENIALSGDLECTRKALEKAKSVLTNLHDYARLDGFQECDVEEAIAEIKAALEQKDVK